MRKSFFLVFISFPVTKGTLMFCYLSGGEPELKVFNWKRTEIEKLFVH